ncbi:anti-sigma B factor antagonist [Nonomuraea jiangxiensis]|uniref:Anti-sigma factor antagonist n=1 Tax=Nonomuraea jiangxiensis TaxID=633440 RepID=A0A1G8D6Y3_9ACTN|nr:anti-sigma B factor antagonist [Nonomuraea jiangxiensis]
MRDIEVEVAGPVGDCAVIKVAGEIDVFTAPQLREHVLDLAAKGVVHIVADMGAVEFLDSTGLGVLVGGLKRLRMQEGSLALARTTDRIQRILRITGLSAVFPGNPSVAAAIEANPHWVRTLERKAGGVEEWCRQNSLS